MSWKHDWNGDGKIDNWDAMYETYMVVQIVEEQEREERIQTLTNAIAASGLTQIGNWEFAALCQNHGVRMDDFEQCDIDEIQRRLDRY